MSKYITVSHVEDWSIKVKAKVIKETETETEAEYQYKRMTYGVTIPKQKTPPNK